MKDTHLFTSDEKIKWWGYGEWVEEPDLVEFQHNGIDCKVMRTAIQEPYAKEFDMFGGYLCGYVRISSDHPYYQKRYEDINVQCHYGLSSGKCGDEHWIGFDCGHSGDYIPSTEHMKKTAPCAQELRNEEEELKKRFNLHDSPIFNRTYRNIQFCIEQCKDVADQLIESKVNGGMA